MALSPIALWASAAAATVAVAGAGAGYWVYANRGASPIPAIADLGKDGASSLSARESAAQPAEIQPAAASRAPETHAAPAEVAANAPEPATAPAPTKPAFDAVNVSPVGETVVAGRAAPNVKVELRDSGRLLASATADASGQFVIIPDALPPGSHELSLATGEGASAESSNSIAVAVAEPPKAAPPAVGGAPATAGAVPAIAVKSVEVGPGGRFVAHGEASPNATVRLYLSGVFVGDARTGDDGHWSLTVQSGMTQGAYTLRADEVRPDGTVQARAEAPFDFPRVSSERGVAAAVPSSPADLVLASVQTAHVKSGDTLWGLSQTFYGDGSRYKLIFAANTGQIRNPNLIYPGQTFVVPKPEPNSGRKS